MLKIGSQAKQTKPPIVKPTHALKDFEGEHYEPHLFTTKISMPKIPYKIFVPQAIATDMQCVTGLIEKEVSWLGLVDRIDKGFLISEIFVPDQEVTFGETEMSEEGILKVAEMILDQENGLERVNKLRLWCHTHPNGGTSPSGQDDKQAKKFMKDVDDFFIRGIATKAGKIEFTVYFIEENVIVYDAPWEIYNESLTTSKDYWLGIVNETVKSTPKTNFNRGGQSDWATRHRNRKPGTEWCFKQQKWVDPEDVMTWDHTTQKYVKKKIITPNSTHHSTTTTIVNEPGEIELAEVNQAIIEMLEDEQYNHMSSDELLEEYWQAKGYLY